jgi:ATP-dependent DNA helicase RecG
LLADSNGTSIKVAKYAGADKIDLIENNEYGYCSLIKATHKVLDKLDIENKTATLITHKTRKEQPLWNKVALREAVINAIVHNDYTTEIPPVFEIYSDRIEITSTGGISTIKNLEDFFAGYSKPINRELMRIYKDIELVEHLGSGLRINGGLRATQLSEDINTPLRTIERWIKELKDEGKIEYKGSRKTGGYFAN